jgi:hypothetical protein
LKKKREKKASVLLDLCLTVGLAVYHGALNDKSAALGASFFFRNPKTGIVSTDEGDNPQKMSQLKETITKSGLKCSLYSSGVELAKKVVEHYKGWGIQTS